VATQVKVVFHNDKVIKAIESSASKRMLGAVNAVRNQALETLSGHRTGKTYRVPGTKKTYTASAPGEPPAQATGELRQSIAYNIETEGKTVIGKVGTDKIQGKMTEYGTRHMKPRPWLRVSFEKTSGKIKSIFGGNWL